MVCVCVSVCVYVRAYVVNKCITLYVGTLCDLFCAYAMSFDSSIYFYIILFHRDMYERVSVQMCAYVDVCVYVYIYTFIYTYIHTYTYTYIYTYICTYTCIYIHAYGPLLFVGFFFSFFLLSIESSRFRYVM